MSKQIYIDSEGNEIQVSGTVNSADMMPLSASDSTKVATAITALQNRENIKIRQTQFTIPQVSVTEGQEATFFSNTDIRTFPYQALDNVTQMTETLKGAVFLWCSGASCYPTDLLVQDGKATLKVRGIYNWQVTTVRLLTFWE